MGKGRLQRKCPKCGELGCWDHCNNCGADIIWRPSLLDKEIKYTGPKPLNRDDESPHDRCMYGSSRNIGDPVIDNIPSFSKQLGDWLIRGLPRKEVAHYKSIAKFKKCVIPECYCHELEKIPRYPQVYATGKVFQEDIIKANAEAQESTKQE